MACGYICLSMKTGAAPFPSPLQSIHGHTYSPTEIETPRPGQVYVFIPQIIRGPDKMKLLADGHRADRLLVYVGYRQSRLENFDHFNLLYPACLLYPTSAFIKPCEVVLIFLFSM